MKRIIKLTESDLTRIIKRVIEEGEGSPNQNRFVPCSQLGVKYPGNCELKTKRPVESCSKFGVKTPGYCYVDTKKPVPSK